MITADESVFRVESRSPATLGRMLAAIGRGRPVVFDELMGAPLVLRHKDVSAGLRDTETFSTKFYGMVPMAGSMIAQDGREHARQRQIHSRFFNPAASRRYIGRVKPVAVKAFSGLPGPTAELVEDAIAHYPMRVFLDLLGIPDEAGDQGRKWARAIVTWLGAPLDENLTGRGLRAYRELSGYTAALVERERANPRDNLLGEIIRAHLVEDRYSVDASVVAVASLLLGGFEATIQMLNGTLAALLLHPEALARVRADRSLIDQAIDEALRWANPSAGLYRLVHRDVEIAGTSVKAGSMVYLCIAAAHHDGEAYPDPEVFDIDRRPSHLGFGLGPHYCVGTPLAKIEVHAAVDALLDAYPMLRLDPDRDLSFRYGARGFVQHGTEALPVLLTEDR